MNKIKLPNANLACIQNGTIVQFSTEDLFSDGINILVGLPGAFTPICTKDHIPTLISSAERLHTLGIKNIYCFSDDNAWAIDHWKEQFDDHEKIMFLSDGNREFINTFNVICEDSDLFLKGKYGRFYAIIENNEVQYLDQEVTIRHTICTTGSSIEKSVLDYMQNKNGALEKEATG